jgi:hypothetical protein
MNEFVATVTVRLAAGTYVVTILHDERGAPDGARLVRVDVAQASRRSG